MSEQTIDEDGLTEEQRETISSMTKFAVDLTLNKLQQNPVPKIELAGRYSLEEASLVAVQLCYSFSAYQKHVESNGIVDSADQMRLLEDYTFKSAVLAVMLTGNGPA